MSVETMENGTYEVIKNRLIKEGDSLKEGVDKLNELRKDVFGSIETKLLLSERIITEHNCIPRDMAPVDDLFIFGYNVLIGLKSKVELNDVFSVYKYENKKLIEQSLDLIRNQEFINDFEELYKYYKNTFFAKFTIVDPYFYMIFQTGKNPTDIKVFKWAIEGNKLVYIDCRSEHEVRFKFENQFNFVKATRDDQRSGAFPHISILDRVFVETIKGDLTIKVEDNTETGKGIYSEPVDDIDQTLDDAEIYYCELDKLIILKIKPYKENSFRYFIFNEKLKSVVRIDSIKDTCRLLPNHQGLIFPSGYYLQTGEYKLFDVEAENCVFSEKITSSNGEDYQYIFYSVESGQYLIYNYNIIEQKIETPIVCSGYSHFNNGEMIVFKQENEPRKNHMLQIWQTPYVGKNYDAIGKKDSPIFSIGNKDIVRAMADCRGICKLIGKKEGYQSIYEDIVKESQRIIDSYFWIDKKETFNLKSILIEIKETATFAIGEFEKVQRIKSTTKKQIEGVVTLSEELLKKLKYGSFDSIDEYVKALGEIRSLRGEIASLKDLRYTDLDLVNKLDKDVIVKYDEFSQKCIDFLLDDEGLKPYEEKVVELGEEVLKVLKSQDGKELEKKMNATSVELELLIDIISNFKIEDSTITTAIIEKISSLFSLINNSKARLTTRIEELTKGEMTKEFYSQTKLLSQSVTNYLDISDTVAKCDEYANKVMITIQELEGKFAEFDEFVLLLGEKREELYNAFESKKQSILEKQNKKVLNLFSSAERIINGIKNRLNNLKTVQEINGYLATDLMVEKVRDIINSLNDLKETVKADEIAGKLKKLKDEAIRQLKDKQELYLNGENVITLGKHHFSVNTNEVDVSIVERDNGLYYHVTGTDFFDKISLENIKEYKKVFNQSIVSENNDVYRGEYLAYNIFKDAMEKRFESIDVLNTVTENQLVTFVQKYMEGRYEEGYTKGVHDRDGAKILKALLELNQKIDLLVFNGEARAMARLYFKALAKKEDKNSLRKRLKELSKVSLYFNKKPNLENYLPKVIENIKKEKVILSIFNEAYVYEASNYLCLEIMKGEEFVVSKEAKILYDSFKRHLTQKGLLGEFLNSVGSSKVDLEGLYFLVKECLNAYIESVVADENAEYEEVRNLINSLNEDELSGLLKETSIILMEDDASLGRVIFIDSKMVVSGLVGSHNTIDKGMYTLSYNTFINKLKEFSTSTANVFLEFSAIKKKLIKEFKENIHLGDFKPQILTSFVRNKLIDKVYLPLIGDNFAKQIGVVGENKRTDLMGLLLLLSPPGYGKTTLIEYVASRLGLIFVKINGPAIGHEVTSLDPELTKNFAAREELKKLNIALKMGNNVLLYLDDIQHCNPEFLQKFISLCDGQRKIEGVYGGKSQTYDLRGKKVAVVMAGNPYTESGEKFKIPDMLANRADVYNLGDMLMENEEAFKLSYIENAVTSNTTLAKLQNTNSEDLYSFIEMAESNEKDGINLKGNYSIEEINEYISILDKLSSVRDIVLKVNLEYIYSAAQADEYRVEPAFKLQGSYRNMNKISEKIIPIMNEEELYMKIVASYENDAQTLTQGAEANMLKFKELMGIITDREKKRYDDIKDLFIKNKLVKGDDKIGQAVLALTSLTENLGAIKDILESYKIK